MADESFEDFLAPEPAAPAPRKPDPDAVPEPVVTVKVASWTQIGHEGQVYPGGSTLSAPTSLAESWIAHGWAVATPKGAKGRK